MRRATLLLLAGICLVACSITVPGGLSKASSPVEHQHYEVLGKATGKSKGVFILGIQTSKASVNEAIARAVATFPDGDALIKISTMQKQTSWMVLPVSTLEVTVTGEVIQFTDSDI
ncbi:hypothetical protein KKF64_00150 [Patescibacteria group bacterium]|nr:hypothetical protein [Patescibacteria group bacterium]